MVQKGPSPRSDEPVAANPFVFVDTAVGGASNRNDVVRHDVFSPPPGATDCYATYLRFTEDLHTYMQEHPNEKGNPSVSGYPGPARATSLPFDLDSEQDPTIALDDARRLVRHSMARYDVPSQAIRVYFSGCKGFSIELGATLFGGFEPSTDIAERLKRLAVCMASGSDTLDLCIYEKMRLWRVPNTINSKTGLYKVPLTVEELLTLDLDAIKALAIAPREIDVPSDDEWSVIPDLQALWMTTSQPSTTHALSMGQQGNAGSQKILKATRNSTLTSLAGSMRRRGMEEAAILAALRETNAAQCEPPLAEAEVQRIAQSVARYSPGENPASEEHLTDMGNARRLMKHCGEDLRYVRAWRKWLAWDGARWEKDETGEIERRAKSTILSIYDDLPSVSDDGKRSLLAKHAIRSQAIHRIQAMIGLAESEQEVAVRSEQFDRDPWLLNVANGTINLKTSLLREHDRNDLITKLAPVVYDPNAQCRIFDAFLDRIFAANRDLIGFVQRAVGYSLTGDTSERALFILHGTGRNGKSTLLNVLRAALGDYALRTPTETLLAKRDGAIPNDVARLKGARFVTASETEEGKRLAESFIKDVTGGDVISARFMRAEFFDFKPECKVWLATNHKPSIRGTDNGIWDRIRLIPFGVRIPESEEDKELLAKLCDELPGILRWAVDGCIAWQRDGLGTPTAVREATESYRNENDVLGRFVEDCCCVLSGASVRSSDLYEAYKRWCDQNGEHPQTQKAFSMRVAELGFEKRRHDTGAWWYGVGLLTGVHDLTDPDGSLRIDKTNRSHEGLNGKSRQDPSDPSGSVAALGEEAYARIRRLKEQFTKAAGSNGGAR